MSGFFITVPSFIQKEFPNNTPQSFKVRLPTPSLPFDEDEWVVGLSTITLPDSRLNLSLLEEEDQGETTVLATASWRYKQYPGPIDKVGSANVTVKDLKEHPYIVDGNSLVRALFTLLDQRRTTNLPANTRQSVTDYPDYTWKDGPLGKELTLFNHDATHDDARVFIRIDFAKKMGWVIEHPVNKRPLIGHTLLLEWKEGGRPAKVDLGEIPSNPVAFADNMIQLSNDCRWRLTNMNTAFQKWIGNPNRVLHIYSNIGKSTILGDQITDLLREIRYVREGKGSNYFEPRHIQYHDVRNKKMEIIEMQVSETNGTLVDFGRGHTTITLHFRKA